MVVPPYPFSRIGGILRSLTVTRIPYLYLIPINETPSFFKIELCKFLVIFSCRFPLKLLVGDHHIILWTREAVNKCYRVYYWGCISHKVYVSNYLPCKSSTLPLPPCADVSSPTLKFITADPQLLPPSLVFCDYHNFFHFFHTIDM